MPQVLWLSLQQVAQTVSTSWPFLAAGILIAAGLRLFVSPQQIAALFHKRRVGAVVLATGVAVATPLCSCGTMAVILGMLASAVPWAPVVAFMVASPLTSPQELALSAGLFGWPFALAFFGASIGLGLLGGAAAHVLERRGWLSGQARHLSPPAQPTSEAPRPKGGQLAAAFAREAWNTARQLVPLFLAFAFIGYLLNNLIPAHWVEVLFGRGNWGVPLAATLGLPLYVNTDASLPLVRAFIDHGATAGAALAFLITGAGTSVGAIAGAFAIARWRVIALVVGTLWVGGIFAGYAYDALGGGVSPATSPQPPPGIERDVAALTGPEAAGRLSGTEGAAKAGEYLARALRDAGAEPAGSEGYFQPLEVPAARLTGRPTLRVGDRALVHRHDFAELAPVSRGGSAAGPLEVVDTEQVSAGALAGRVVLLPHAPADMDFGATAAAMAELGARGLLVGTSGFTPFNKTVSAGAGRIPVLRVRESLVLELAHARGAQVSLELPLESGARPCRNVVGVLRGTGGGRAVLLAAHYDHVGDDPGGERFPGAFDNASGVAAVLEATRRLASGPRLPFDVVIAFTTGEESGLWGMRHLAAHPPEPLAAAITLDGLGAPPGLSALRLGQAAPGDALGALVADVVREKGIEPQWIPGTDDSAALRRAGIPVVGLGQQPAATVVLPLHTTKDDAAGLDRGQIASAAGLLVEILERLEAEGLAPTTGAVQEESKS